MKLSLYLDVFLTHVRQCYSFYECLPLFLNSESDGSWMSDVSLHTLHVTSSKYTGLLNPDSLELWNKWLSSCAAALQNLEYQLLSDFCASYLGEVTKLVD